ncbi:MAG: hypothetical protein OXK81_14680, partial [Chloroflexota bacterium]|nr:hypothetical protein [Chloroflexota bacterium]
MPKPQARCAQQPALEENPAGGSRRRRRGHRRACEGPGWTVQAERLAVGRVGRSGALALWRSGALALWR